MVEEGVLANQHMPSQNLEENRFYYNFPIWDAGPNSPKGPNQINSPIPINKARSISFRFQPSRLVSVSKMIPVPVGEEVGPKLVRLLYFVGAGVLCTAAINKWKDLERKSVIQKQQKLNGPSLENPSTVVQEAVE